MNTVQMEIQPKETLIAYIDYVEAKIDIGEVPLQFFEWAYFERQPEQKSKLIFY